MLERVQKYSIRRVLYKQSLTYSDKLDILKLDPADRKEYDRYMEGQRSDASFVETVKLEITSAVKSREEEIAENALQKGLAIEVVAEITGLSIAEVQNIASNLGNK